MSQGGRGSTKGNFTQLAPPPLGFDSKILPRGRGFAMAAILEDQCKRTWRGREFDFY